MINSTHSRALIKQASQEWATQKTLDRTLITQAHEELNEDGKNKLSLINECVHLILRKKNRGSITKLSSGLNNDQLLSTVKNLGLQNAEKIAESIRNISTHKHESDSSPTLPYNMKLLYSAENTGIRNWFQINNGHGLTNEYREFFANRNNVNILNGFIRELASINPYSLVNNPDELKRECLNKFLGATSNSEEMMQEAAKMICDLMMDGKKALVISAEKRILENVNENLQGSLLQQAVWSGSSQQSVENLTSHINNNLKEKKNTIAQKDQRISHLDRMVLDLEEKQEETQEQLEKVRISNSQLCDEKDKLSKKLEKANKRLESLQTQYKELSVKSQKIEAEMDKLKSDKGKLTDDKAKLEITVVQLQKEISSIKSQIETMSNDKRKIETELEQNQVRIDKYKQETSIKDNQITSLNKTIKNLKEARNQLQGENTRLTNKILEQDTVIQGAKRLIELTVKSTNTGSIESLGSDSQPTFNVIDSDNTQIIETNENKDLTISKYDIKKSIDDLLNKNSGLPGAFIEEIEQKGKLGLTDKNDGINEIRAYLNELYDNKEIQYSFKSDKPAQFMKTVVKYGITHKIDLAQGLSPPAQKALRLKYNKSIEKLNKAALVKILAIMYMAKIRQEKEFNNFNTFEKNSFCETMNTIRKDNDNLKEWLPTQTTGSIFNAYSKNINLAYPKGDDSDYYVLGNKTFNVKVNITKISELFKQKSSGNEHLDTPKFDKEEEE